MTQKMPHERSSCAEFLRHGCPGWRKVAIRFAGDAADGVVQAARLVARGFATQGFPVQMQILPTSAIRAEPGSPGGHFSVDLRFLIPNRTAQPRICLPDQEPARLDQGWTQQGDWEIDGMVIFRPASLTRSAAGLAPGAWILMDADALSAKQLSGEMDPKVFQSPNIPCEIQPVSFLNLPRELDMDRHWRRTQRLLTPKEQSRCRAFTPVGWIAGRFGLPLGAWDLWVQDRFRNHPPLREMSLTLIRAGYQAGENHARETIVAPFSQPPLMEQGVWRMASSYEALVLGLAQAARSSGKLVHLCIPLDPALTPLIRSARTLADHGLRTIEGATPIESVRNALGVFLAGGIGVSVGASTLDAGFKGERLRPGGRWIRLEETDGKRVPDLADPSALERFGKRILSFSPMTTAIYAPDIWRKEEPILLSRPRPGLGGETIPGEAIEGEALEGETLTHSEDETPIEALPSNQVPVHIPDWCPGCGNFAILEHLSKVLYDEGAADKAILAAPGCAGKIARGIGIPAYWCPPGAAFGIARGVTAAWPGVQLWIAAGDGELSGPSLGGVIRAIHENQPIKILFVNNETAASADGLETLMTPTHSWNRHRESQANGPLPLAGIMLVAGAGYYARSLDVEVETLANSLRGASGHQGTAVVEVWQNCKIHNDGNHDDMIDRQISRRHRIDLVPGRAIVFDFEPERCLVWTGSDFESRVKLSVAPEKVIVHEPESIPVPLAVALASLGVARPAEASCFGVFVAREGAIPPITNGIREVRSDGWLHGPDAWVIPDYPEFPPVEETA